MSRFFSSIAVCFAGVVGISAQTIDFESSVPSNWAAESVRFYKVDVTQAP